MKQPTKSWNKPLMIGDKLRGSELTTAFGDLLAMLVCECTPHWIDNETGRPIGRYTDRYLEVVKRYDPDHIRKYYPKVCETLFATYDCGVTATGGWGDPLGDYFQAIASRRDQAWSG